MRYICQLGFGNVPQRDALRAIELLGTEVLPAVRRALGQTGDAAAETEARA